MVAPKVTWGEEGDDNELPVEQSKEIQNTTHLETDSDDKIFDKDDKSPENTQRLEDLLNPSGGSQTEQSPLASSMP